MTQDPLPACSCADCFWGTVIAPEAPVRCGNEESSDYQEWHPPDDCCPHYREPKPFDPNTGLPFGQEEEKDGLA